MKFAGVVVSFVATNDAASIVSVFECWSVYICPLIIGNFIYRGLSRDTTFITY